MLNTLWHHFSTSKTILCFVYISVSDNNKRRGWCYPMSDSSPCNLFFFFYLWIKPIAVVLALKIEKKIRMRLLSSVAPPWRRIVKTLCPLGWRMSVSERNQFQTPWKSCNKKLILTHYTELILLIVCFNKMSKNPIRIVTSVHGTKTYKPLFKAGRKSGERCSACHHVKRSVKWQTVLIG
jgi:hypothetical protein